MGFQFLGGKLNHQPVMYIDLDLVFVDVMRTCCFLDVHHSGDCCAVFEQFVILPEEELTDADTGRLWPKAFCAFVGCTWISQEGNEEALHEHLLQEHSAFSQFQNGFADQMCEDFLDLLIYSQCSLSAFNLKSQ